jgi:hypothetical protein
VAIKPISDRAAVPLGIGVLALVTIAVGWLVFQGAPFILGCMAMLVLAASELALLVRQLDR